MRFLYRPATWRQRLLNELVRRELACKVICLLLLCGAARAQTGVAVEKPGQRTAPPAAVSSSAAASQDEDCSTSGAVEREVTVRIDGRTLEVISKPVGEKARCVELTLPKPGRTATVNEGMVFVSLAPLGLAVVDLSEPRRPRFDRIVHPELVITSMRVADGNLWIVDANNVVSKIPLPELRPIRSAPNATKDAAPDNSLPSSPSSTQIDSRPITELSTTGSMFQVFGNTILLQVQKADLSRISTKEVSFEGTIISVLRLDNELYVAHRDNLISILDITDPANPMKLGLVGTQGTITGLRRGSSTGTLDVDEQSGRTKTYTTVAIKRIASTAKPVDLPPDDLLLTGRNDSPNRTRTPKKYLATITAEGAYRWLMVDSIFLGCLSFSLGSTGERITIGGTLSGCAGSTLIGVVMIPLSGGLNLNVVARPWLRFGANLTAGSFLLVNHKNQANAFGDIGISFDSKFDVYSIKNRQTLFTIIRGGVEVFPAMASVSPLIQLGIGIR